MIESINQEQGRFLINTAPAQAHDGMLPGENGGTTANEPENLEILLVRSGTNRARELG